MLISKRDDEKWFEMVLLICMYPHGNCRWHPMCRNSPSAHSVQPMSRQIRRWCLRRFSAKMSLWAFLFAAFLQNKMAKIVWKIPIFTELRHFLLPITSESSFAMKANHQFQTGSTLLKQKGFPSNSNWEKAWSVHNPSGHIMSAAAVCRQNYASLMLMSTLCPESVLDLCMRCTRIVAERHKHRFLIWRLIL